MSNVSRNGYTDFSRYNTNNDNDRDESEMRRYLDERYSLRRSGVSDREKGYINTLIEGLRKDGALTLNDFHCVADAIWDAEKSSVGHEGISGLPDMSPTKNWSGDIGRDMPKGKRVSLNDAYDCLKFYLQNKSGISDAEKLFLFNRLNDVESGGKVDCVDVSNLVEQCIPAFNIQNVF